MSAWRGWALPTAAREVTGGRDPLAAKRRSLLRATLDADGGGTGTGTGGLAEPAGPDACLNAGRRAGPHIAPLSFAQERMWFLDQYETDHPIYNMPMAQDLPAPLDVRAARRAIDELVRRQASLRTTFPLVDGRPAQVVLPAGPVPVAVVDLSARRDVGPDLLLDQLVAAERHAPFDLAAGPLFRASFVHLPGGRGAVVMNMHHIVSDGWSTGLLLRELQELYAAFVTGGPSPLPDLELTYVDHARRQRDELTGETLDALLAYWSRQLACAPPVLALPTDHPRPRHQTFRGETLLFSIPDAVVRPLATLGSACGATLFMTLLAAFDVLLHRYTGQDDVVVGTPIANRNRADVEGLVGLFANTLVLRTDVSGDPRFCDLLDRVRSLAIGAYAHQELPFERLVVELQPARALSHGPLFQVMFALQNTPTMGRRVLDELYESPGRSVVIEETPARFDLALFLGDADRGLAAELEYNVDLFDRATMRRLARHFANLLGAIAAAPECRLSELDVLDEDERRVALDHSRGPRPGPPPVECVHQLVEREARSRPDAPAVVSPDGTTSYRELDDRADQLAGQLRAMGIGPGTRVAIHLPRSVEAIVATLAALKAGAAYVPLDPDLPVERLTFMVDDAGAAALVTLAAWRDRLRVDGIPGTAVVAVDAPAAGHADGPCPAPSGAPTADDLAYVIYTSGSTGRPKGVAMSHRPLVNLLHWQSRDHADGPAPRTLHFAALGFDVCFQEVFATLGAGGTLVIVDDDARLDLDRLLAEVDASGVQRLFLPPAVLAQLSVLPSATEVGPSSVAEVICAGEQLVVTDAVAALLDRMGAGLRNQYGPTETHVVTELRLDGAPGEWPRRPSIGRPIDGAVTYVLDGAGRLAPTGVPGELHVGGVALARGYLDRSDLTAERFVPDPFGPPGATMFRTGDRVRRLASGDLEFLGRCDDQLSIRGFRVEPGEIEAVLAEHATVRHAAVAARAGPHGDPTLVAFVVGEDGTDIDPTDLLHHLARRLPAAMVPRTIVPLDALPLSRNGKVDHDALPSVVPDGDRPGLAPRSPLEEQLADLWRRVLGVDRVGVDDDFFEVGGHSLLATQVVSRLRREMGVDLPLRRLFEPPSTVADLAVAVVEARLGAVPAMVARDQLVSVEALSDSELAAELRLPSGASADRMHET